MAHLDKIKLAEYVITKCKREKKCDISPIKLQKSLYYLYAYWAGNIANIKSELGEDDEGICECRDTGFDIDLFEPCFEAWKYGPVDREIYHKYKEGQLNDNVDCLILGEDTLQSSITSFVDSILDQTFNINDFALVDLTHLDESWKLTFQMSPQGDGKIAKESIISEYKEKTRRSAS